MKSMLFSLCALSLVACGGASQTSTEVKEAEPTPSFVKLDAAGAKALAVAAQAPGFASFADTVAGRWECTTATAGGKICTLRGVDLNLSDIEALGLELNKTSFGGSVTTTAGAWSCTTPFVGPKICMIDAPSDELPAEEAQSMILRASDIHALKNAVEAGSFGVDIQTSVGPWQCTNGIATGKICTHDDVQLNKADILDLDAAVSASSFGAEVPTSAGTWSCSTPIAGEKLCALD